MCLWWQEVKRLWKFYTFLAKTAVAGHHQSSSVNTEVKWYHLLCWCFRSAHTHTCLALPYHLMCILSLFFCRQFWRTKVWQLVGIQVWVFLNILVNHFFFTKIKLKNIKVFNVQNRNVVLAKWKVKQHLLQDKHVRTHTHTHSCSNTFIGKTALSYLESELDMPDMPTSANHKPLWGHGLQPPGQVLLMWHCCLLWVGAAWKALTFPGPNSDDSYNCEIMGIL